MGFVGVELMGIISEYAYLSLQFRERPSESWLRKAVAVLPFPGEFLFTEADWQKDVVIPPRWQPPRHYVVWRSLERWSFEKFEQVKSQLQKIGARLELSHRRGQAI